MTVATLSRCAIFNNLDKEYIHYLHDSAKRIAIAKDQYVFHQNDTGEGMYIVLSGSVNIVLAENDTLSGNHVINTLKQGDFFGEICLLGKQPRTASAVAAEDTQLLFIHTEDFARQIDQNNINALKMGFNIALKLRTHVEKTNAAIINLYKQISATKAPKEIEKYKLKLLSEVLF